jgi:nitrogenase molybdenum-iron cofactor biosynthesis protein NifE/nitrogenase molybdenum-iron cofactor biosynthesis protein NifN
MSDALKARTLELFEEPGCSRNQAKGIDRRKQGCSKPLVPGAAAGGCALDGAKIALQPITDAVHLVHGPIACECNGWDSRHAATSGPTLYRHGATTDLSEMDIVMGTGEKKLYRAIKEIVSKTSPQAVFVYSTCVTALTGDDVDAVCRHAASRLGLPVVPVHAPGFAGSKNFGSKLASLALLDHVIGTVEPDDVGPTDINILGEYNLCGELWQIRPLLEHVGIRIRACITGDSRYRQIATAHRARVNMIACSAALLHLARVMKERWEIPYVEGSFYGIRDTSATLRAVARLLVDRGADADLSARVETLIGEREASAWAALAPYRKRLEGRRVLLYTGGVKSWSIVSALQELGMEVIGTSVRKSTEEDKTRIAELLGASGQMFESLPQREMHGKLKHGDADIMLSGGRTQFVALKAKVPWLDINQERQVAYAGYDGIVTLARQIDREIHNPVWREVRRPAPWDLRQVAPSVGGTDCRTQEVQAVARVRSSPKACSLDPLKSSAPLGAALAFLGIEGSVPLFHGAQGCTSFALVLAVRHFREAIPLQTTALDEVSTILGGSNRLEQALVNLKRRMNPKFIGVASTALVETRGEDLAGELRSIRSRCSELSGTVVVFASTPDFEGALEDGWANAATAVIEALVPGEAPRGNGDTCPVVNVLPGVHETAADIDELRALIESFGLKARIVPDLSSSLDGHVPDAYVATSLGGARLEDIKQMGVAAHTIAIGEHMRKPADALQSLTAVPTTVFPTLLGLESADHLVALLSRISGRPAPSRLRQERSRLVDAMLDCHFAVSGKRVAVGADPDLLLAHSMLLESLGADVVAAVSSTEVSPRHRDVPYATAVVGDLTDLEDRARLARAELLVTHSHGRRAAERLGIPLFRIGFPIFDRIGAQHRRSVGYAGTRDVMCEVANAFLSRVHDPTPLDFADWSQQVKDEEHGHDLS